MDAETMESPQESKRERVRRLLIRPLEEGGLKRPKSMSEDDHHGTLTRLADRLSYMSDNGLKILAASLMTKGEGSSHNIWPSVATVLGLAEAFEPQPLEEQPELLRWFASAAGKEALAAGRLVAEYEFFRKRKRPPLHRAEKTIIDERAYELNRRAARVRERAAADMTPLYDDDPAFLRWYEERVAYLEHLVSGAGVSAE